MTDMLVKLYELPPVEGVLAEQRAQGITIRRALATEQRIVLDWVREHFFDNWASECAVAFAHQPISCYIAVEGQNLLGFGCYDVTAKGFFGPTGVSEAARGRGVGKALLLICLHNLWWDGYGYAIIGGVGPADFYTRVCGAVAIPDSHPGLYAGMLKEEADDQNG